MIYFKNRNNHINKVSRDSKTHVGVQLLCKFLREERNKEWEAPPGGIKHCLLADAMGILYPFLFYHSAVSKKKIKNK
jgi:hypothetical protein